MNYRHAMLQGIQDVANVMHQYAGWINRTFTRPEPAGSQHGEDVVISALLPEACGVYVDIGASEPVQTSNTWLLYERGWRGLLVEPRKDAVYDLCANRPGDYIYAVCASDRDGWARLRLMGSVSSLRTDWNIQEQATAFCLTETMATILSKFPAIRDACLFCSIDVEGHEAQVLKGIDWTTFKPRVICVEYYVYNVGPPDNDATSEWEPILLAQGYALHHTTQLNKIYTLQQTTDAAH